MRDQAILTGEFVSNAPLRARCEWLLRYDPDFSLNKLCQRLCDQGFEFEKKKRSRGQTGRFRGETTHALRLLGMRDQAPSCKNGRRYVPPNRTAWIPYELAVAFARALDMDPVDADV